MKKLILVLSIISILIPSMILANGYSHQSGSRSSGIRIGVGPNGNVFGGIAIGSNRHYSRTVRHRPVHLPAYGHRRYYGGVRYRHYSPHNMPQVIQPVVYQTIEAPAPRPAPRLVYVNQQPSVQYNPGQTATVTRADGTKEIIYVEGATVRGSRRAVADDVDTLKLKVELMEAKLELAKRNQVSPNE